MTLKNHGTGGALHAVFTVVFLLVASWSWVGLLGAELGIYRPAAVAALGAIGAIAGALVMRRSLRPSAWHVPAPALCLLLTCLALATILFFRPGEYLIDGGDGSVYLNIGRAVSRFGALSFAEPLLHDIDPVIWPDLLQRDTAWPYLLNFFPGGIQVDPGINRIRPNFFHLFPIWIANAEAVAGPRAGYYVNAVFGVLSVAALWMLGSRLSSLVTGTIASFLLTLSFAQIWFARFPSSEMLAQYLVLAGLYFAVSHAPTRVPTTAFCAGAAFGLAGLCRLDVLVLVSPVVALYLLFGLRRDGGRDWIVFTATFAALSVHAVVHALVWSRPYTERIAWHLLGGWVKPSILIGPAAVAVGAFVWWRLSRTAWSGTSRILGWALIGTTALVLALHLAPRIAGGHPAMLVTAPAIAAAVAGALLLAGRRPAAPALLLVGIYAASALVYFESVRDAAAMPLLFRRFIPVILPLTLLLAAHAFWRVWVMRSPLRWAGILAPAALAIVLATRSAPIVATAAMRGVAAQVETLAAAFPANAVVLADASTPSHLGLSLHYTEGINVLWIDRASGTETAIRTVAATVSASNRRLFLLLGADGAAGDHWLRPADFAPFALRPSLSMPLRLRQVEASVDRVPERMHDVAPLVDVYEVLPVEPRALPLQLEIGESDFSSRRDGFYGREQMGDATARWSSAVAHIALPQIAAPAGHLVLRARLAGPRPPGMTPPRVEVEIDGRPVGQTAALGAGFDAYDLPLDAVATNALLSRATMLTLRTPTFVPANSSGGDDRRLLGVAVDWVRIERR